MAKAVYINGKTSEIWAFFMPWGIRSPVRMITAVPHNELNVPPDWMS